MHRLGRPLQRHRAPLPAAADLHLDLEINWPGRLAVWPTMSAIVFALIGLHVTSLVLLYVGLALGLLAMAMYYRDGMAALRNARPRPSSSA